MNESRENDFLKTSVLEIYVNGFMDITSKHYFFSCICRNKENFLKLVVLAVLVPPMRACR